MNEPLTEPAVASAGGSSYGIGKIIRLWAVATGPLVALGWGAGPFVAARFPSAAPVLYWLLMTAGMGWVGYVSLRTIQREEGRIRWSTLARRVWLSLPCSPHTDMPQARLFWRLLPCLLVASVGLMLQLALMLTINTAMAFSFPLAWWPRLWPGYANLLELVSPQFSDHGLLAAGVMAFWLVSNLVAEELFFRGLLLPRMQGSFGKKDWLVNGMLHAAYSVYQPWMIPVRFVDTLAVAWPVRRYRSLPLGLIVRGFSAIGLLAALWLGFYERPLKSSPASLPLPQLGRNPPPEIHKKRALTNLPEFRPDNPWFSVDLRSRDLSGLDLRNSASSLEHASFDSQTLWPPEARMPAGFDPAQILELGKNPGLGVRALHAQGVTGRGIGIGIVDHFLLNSHREFAGRIKWYEEINRLGDAPARMHGLAVASIAVGTTVGVAPEADLYYIGVGDNYRIFPFMPHYFAQGIRRLLQVNQRLPDEHKIRAISLSFGPGPGVLGYEDFISAIQEAEAEGILVAWCGEGRFPIFGLNVAPTADRDDFQSCSLPPWLLRRALRSPTPTCLYVPMDSRTTASPTGPSDFVFYGPGGASWTVPYAAGAFALAAQVDPAITPEKFWSLALETGRRVQIKYGSREVTVGPIIDMAAVAKALPVVARP